MNSTVKNNVKLQNTRKIKDIVKRFSIITLSLIFTLMSFTFSFANGQIPIYTSTPSVTDMQDSPVYITFTNGDGMYLASNYSNIDYFYYLDTTSNQYKVVYASSESNKYAYYWYNWQTYVNSNNISSSYNNIFYKEYGWATSQYTLDATTIPYLGEFTNYSYAINYYIANGVNYGPDPVRYPFTLQNGYLFVFDCGQSNTMYSFDLSSKSEEYSDIGSIPFPDTNQSYWFSDSLPEIDETTIPDSNANIISWQKGDKTNIFGQTQDMIATISGTSTGRYLYIYNPPVHYKWSGSSNPTASETINYPMIINGVSVNENWYIYDSIARLTDFNQGGSVTGTVTGENIIGSVSSDGAISLVTSSGAIYTQNSGGSTDISGANGGSLAENINGLKETLDNFVNLFIQLLSAPISHIQQLIQSSHQFFDVFSQLFEWLPSELSSVIVSGLIIMVVIGVIKMLL